MISNDVFQKLRNGQLTKCDNSDSTVQTVSDLIECASCGRKDEPGPQGAHPISSGGILWCSYCAATIETDDGKKIVNCPSPGRMIESVHCDPLGAWQDCYSIRPKKRILKKHAKLEIQRAWRNWDGNKTTSVPMLAFFAWLQRHRPYFLTFREKADLYQRVKCWLIEYEDNLQDK